MKDVMHRVYGETGGSLLHCHTFHLRSGSQCGALDWCVAGSWLVQEDLRLFALGAFTVENLPTEALDLQQLPTYRLVLSQGFQLYVTTIIISCSRHPFKNCFLPTGCCAEHVTHLSHLIPSRCCLRNYSLQMRKSELKTQAVLIQQQALKATPKENESPFLQHSYDTPDACREEGIRSVAKVLTRHHLIVTYVTCF